MKIYILVFIYFALVCSSSFGQTKSRGVPASPYPFEINQPDGSKITLIQKGDGVVHWFETEKGYSVLKAKDGWFKYATKNEEGDMVCSELSVKSSSSSDFSIENMPLKRHLRFSSSQIKQKKLNYFGKVSTTKSGMKKAFPTTGTRKVLMIMAEFVDLDHVLPKEDFHNLMNQENYNGTGSFRDYYLEASYNTLDITTTTTVWVKVPKTMEYYGKNVEGQDANPQEFVRSAVEAADAAGVDFSQYDNDGDGNVDAVQIIHSGYGEEAGGGENTIWSHAWALNEKKVEFDGVTINRYVIFPELSGRTGSNITNIGVICHEFGHGLGLPDYYDTSDEGDYAGDAAGLGKWDIMAGGSWNNQGKTPAHHNAYSKYLLGWVELKEFTEDGEYTLNNLAQSSKAYIINSKTENEFFVFENRQQIGFDKYIPHHGMIVYHVDRNDQGWSNNRINANPFHEAMDILEADNNDKENVTADPFPGTGNNTLFSDKTSPNSLSWAGEKTEIEVSNISETDNVINFNYRYVPPMSYTVKFVVKDNGNPVEGVEVKFNDGIKQTDSNGEASFSNIEEGRYVYSVNKLGFYTKNDAVDVNGDIELIEVPVNFIALGIKSGEKEVKVFPNPTSGILYVEGSFSESAIARVINMKGEVLLEKKVKEIDGVLDLTGIKSGIYNVLIQDAKKKIIKQIILK